MKLILFKLSALALVATSMVSAEKPALRGPVVASDAVMEGSSNSVYSKRSDLLVKKEEIKEEMETAKDDVNLPEFFPTGLAEDQIINFKKTAAEQRQDKRDKRRAKTNPNRSQEEENNERARKTRQSEKRGKPDADPYSGNRDFGRDREAKRVARCEIDGVACNFSGPNEECYNDCLAFDGIPDKACARQCKYIDTNCYEDCRGDGDSVGICLDDCEDNINGNRSTRKAFGASSSSFDDNCEDVCENYSSADWNNCMDDCESDE
mmetsp:Transcript_11652/g.20471  ORF Transcript_11652/g.20471 Transcript_11652/m.20471 type:complete len:264 (+) Transcript_11652:78-869(+)